MRKNQFLEAVYLVKETAEFCDCLEAFVRVTDVSHGPLILRTRQL